ncbi:hypothetical protein F4804DRAFT_270105 [Jackrogersella minutella]|nr:hypothetical protein F4804DRAFT_270105 [Jackrogersella minutella]
MAHRRQRPRRRLLNFMPLLAIASTSSALNLSQFQVITSNQIPNSCIRAYQTEIQGCTRNDFKRGKQCSSSCVQGLQQTQDLIDQACEGLDVSAQSILGIALSGGLVNLLCPGFDTTTTTKTIAASPTNGGFSTIHPAPTATSDMSTKASSTSQKTIPTVDSSTIIQSTTDQNTPPLSAASTSDDNGTSSPSSVDATSTQNTVQASATSEAAQSATSDTSSGDDDPTPFVGGSPFDPAPIEGLGTALRPGFCTDALTAVIFTTMFILR